MAPFLAKFGSRRDGGLGYSPGATPMKSFESSLEDLQKITLADTSPKTYASRPSPVVSSPATAFVHSLLTKSHTRKHISQLLKESCLVEGGDLQVTSYLVDEGYDTTMAQVIEALEGMRSSDLLFWTGRYNLFVLWSADRQHPWDSLPAAGRHMTLEIGKQRGAPVLLLNSKPIDHFTFENCVLKTTSPVDWETPNGTVARVNIELQMGSFFGYGQEDPTSGAYLGLQCHGVIWPAATATLPIQWPIAPPLIAGKVNIAARNAAVSPGRSDSLSAFAGSYRTHLLPDSPGKPSKPGVVLDIGVGSQGKPTVTVDGSVISRWTFEANNALAWDEEGSTAWLQFMVLPGGPVFMGNLHTSGGASLAPGFNVFGELKSQPSRLAPDAAMDPSVGRMVASGVSTAATLLCGNLLKSATKTLALLKAGHSAEEVLQQHSDLLTQMQSDFATLARLHAVGATAEATFGGDHIAYEVYPSAAADALKVEADAAESAQAAKVAADAAASAAAETEEGWREGNAMEATSKAGVAAWRASQAASAAAAAEQSALEAAKHARYSQTIAALSASLAAAQSYNLAKDVAYDAAKAEARAASAALRAVEQGIALYAERREYLKLKDIAEASDVAGKALAAANEAVEGWETGSAASRLAANVAAKEAAEFAQLCHKFMRAVQKS